MTKVFVLTILLHLLSEIHPTFLTRLFRFLPNNESNVLPLTDDNKAPFNCLKYDSQKLKTIVGQKDAKQLLLNSIEKWKNQDKKNAVWFRVHVQDGWWTSILSECGFEISHAEKPNTFVMIKWLLSTKSTIPLYPYTQIGVVGLIVDTKGLVLLVKEETQKGDFSWRLPGGAVDHGEHMYDALSRELREEIGIEVPQFSADAQKAPKPCLLAFRHDRLYAWQTFQGISAMMFLFVITTDDSQKIQLKLNDGEIQKAAWISSADAKTKLRGDFNRKALAKYEEWMKNGGKGCMSYENKPDRKEITNTDGTSQLSISGPMPICQPCDKFMDEFLYK